MNQDCPLSEVWVLSADLESRMESVNNAKQVRTICLIFTTWNLERRKQIK